MSTDLAHLEARLKERGDLEAAAAVLRWDQQTFMPPGGAHARGRQLAVLDQIAHERGTDPEIGRLLDRLDAAGLEGDAAMLLRVARRDYERAVKLPRDFVSQLAAHRAEIYDAWTRAKPENDFASVRPLLERGVELSQRYASFFAPHAHVMDPLIENAEPGMGVAKIRALFAELRIALVPLVHDITAAPPADDSCLRQHFPEAEQLAFADDIAKKVGFDFSRGRRDTSPHAFSTKFSRDDVRMTARVRTDFFSPGFFSTLHEAGHSLYEQNIDPSLEGSPLCSGASEGVHESQSRLWENIVGRGRAFWTAFYPALKATFPAQLGGVSLDAFHRAINKVERSLIRTNADEVTYGLHVILRFDFETDLLEGKLAVRDLPEAWRARMKSDFGVAPETDTDGVLQDVHWFDSLVGGQFQGYVLGNLMSAQMYRAALAAHPSIPREIEKGEVGTLREWLRDNVHRHGRRHLPSDLVEHATGKPLGIAPYIDYLRTKYGELYALG